MKLRMPKLMVGAASLWALYAVSAGLGLEDWVGLLSGTPVPGVPLEVAALGGSFHVLSWFGAVVVAPVLAIAAGLLEAFAAMGPADRGRRWSCPPSTAAARFERGVQRVPVHGAALEGITHGRGVGRSARRRVAPGLGRPRGLGDAAQRRFVRALELGVEDRGETLLEPVEHLGHRHSVSELPLE